MKRALILLLVLVPSVALAQLTVSFGSASSSNCFTSCASTNVCNGADFQAAVACAAGKTLFLDNTGGNFVLSSDGTSGGTPVKIDLPSGISIMPAPATIGAVVIQAGTNNPSNSNRNVFESSGVSDITIEGISFIPLSGDTNVVNPPTTASGRAVWKATGGSNLTFNNNIVTNFTDALFHQSNGLSSYIQFLNNSVTLSDRLSTTGGNAAFTAQIQIATDGYNNLDLNGNTVSCPGAQIARSTAIVGLIASRLIDALTVPPTIDGTMTDVDMNNNRISQCSHGLVIYTSGPANNVVGNRSNANGNGLTVGDLSSDITIIKNVFNGNGYDGACVPNGGACPGTGATVSMTGNVLNGNKFSCVQPLTPYSSTNVCRGPQNGGNPGAPPGQTIKGGVGNAP